VRGGTRGALLEDVRAITTWMRRLSRVLVYVGRHMQSTSPAHGSGKEIEESELLAMAKDALVSAGYSKVPEPEEIYNLTRSAVRLGDQVERLALFSLSCSGVLEGHREAIEGFLEGRRVAASP